MAGILEILAGRNGLPSYEFLLIGGFAVVAHGYPRVTFDLDFLIRKRERDRWTQLMLQNGFKILNDQENSMEFLPENNLELQVDFMMVDETIFDEMYSEAMDGEICRLPVKYPRLQDLIALKLEVLDKKISDRYHKDLNDVIQRSLSTQPILEKALR